MNAPYYSDDHVTLYHGDCREVLPPIVGDALVTDPPYGLGDRMLGGRKEWRMWSGGLSWDKSAPEIITTLPGLFRHSIIWGGNYFALPPTRGWLIWDKVVRKFDGGHAELAWTTLDQPVRAFNLSVGQLANEGKVHPTQKPIRLMEWCIRFLPADCETIVDPFAGSGTTLVAAKNEGRRAIGIEAEERYCEIAAKRLTQDTLFGGAA